MNLLLIDNYDSFTWNLAQYFGELGASVTVERNDALTLGAIEARAPEAIVISPGPCTPNEAGISMDVIRRFAGATPILGVCLGHQCIGQVFGGRIVRAPRIMHGKTSKMFHDEKGLFAGVENPFVATRYHSLVIAPESMPDTLEVTAKTWEDEIMGVRARAGGAPPNGEPQANLGGVKGFAPIGGVKGFAPIEGVQFHPESIMTTAGKQLLANFLRMARAHGTAAREAAAS